MKCYMNSKYYLNMYSRNIEHVIVNDVENKSIKTTLLTEILLKMSDLWLFQ